MRKILSFLALALAFTACQNEPVETISNSGLVEVTLHVDAPEMEITRGLDGDTQVGRNSALGAIDFFNDADWAKYDVRYILEVYDENDNGTGEPIYLERLVNCLDKYAPTNFTLRLVPERTYKFVLFADFVADGNHTKVEPADKLAIADWYYDTTDLRNITIKSDADGFNAMNEARDAYFASKNLAISATGLNQSITLTRPFAKLRVITTDLDYIAGYSAPAFVEVTYHTEKVIKSFNAVNGMLSTEELTGKELTHSFEVKKAEPYKEGYDALSTNQTLFADYIFAKEGEQTTVNFTMAVYEDAAKTRLIKTTDFNTQIPVQRNHLTTIIGDILTNEANIEIKIDDNFVDEWIFGAGDGNKTVINTWGSGIMDPATGDYSFDVTAEGNTFHVTVDKTAVSNATLATGEYQFTDKEVTEGKFTATNLKADDTRAMVDVTVVGGMMKVESLNGVYGVTLELVLDYGNNDLRHATYYHEGAILFGETLDAPKATAVAEGNTVTVSWEAIDKATTYYVRLVAEGNEFEATTELSKTYTDLAWETLYQFEVYATNDTLTSVTATVEAKTEAEPVVEQAYKLYFQNIAEWAEVYAHIWANEGEDIGLESVEWPGRKLTETELLDGVTYYVFQLPATATGKTVNVVFNNGAGTQTDDLAGVVEGNLFFDNYVEPVEPAATPKYMVAVPAGFENVIFCRMNPGAAANNWDNKWNQTGDLKVVDGDWYTINEGSWDAGTWSTFELAEDGYLYFTPNANWETDNARFAAYFFGNGEKWVDLEVYTPAGSEPEEPTALATPVVTYEINEGNLVTLSWEAIEGAKDYTATYCDEKLVVEGTSATFDAVVGTYTATVVANPADETKNTVSEAGTVEVTVEAPVVIEPEELVELDTNAHYIFKQATEMKGGKWYAIVSETNAATGLTGNYGYLKITDAIARGEGISLPANCAFGFLTTEGGYTIQQYDGKYVYQTGSYDSFNVNATLPTDGGVWSVAVNGNEYTITNNTMSKFVQYDPSYNSYGCYAASKGNLPTLYELVEVDTTPSILDVSTSKMSFAHEGGSNDVTVTTYGNATLNASVDAAWVSTSIAENVVTVNVEANAGDAREATLTITYGDDSRTIAISQAKFQEAGEVTTYTDTLVSSMFKATSTTYTEFSGVAGTNGAVYAGKSAKSSNGGYIQLRSSKSEDGIVTTASGGKVKKIVVEWDEANTTVGRTLDVYVSNTAYTSATELYGTSVVGEKIGNIVMGTSTELVIEGDYDYVGLRSNSGAMYIKSITITYEK
ncbi:MAG: starch-binding protein [Alistipes sp.]|nr:starch-binding protein [Alistipes sp.]